MCCIDWSTDDGAVSRVQMRVNLLLFCVHTLYELQLRYFNLSSTRVSNSPFITKGTVTCSLERGWLESRWSAFFSQQKSWELLSFVWEKIKVFQWSAKCFIMCAMWCSLCNLWEKKLFLLPYGCELKHCKVHRNVCVSIYIERNEGKRARWTWELF